MVDIVDNICVSPRAKNHDEERKLAPKVLDLEAFLSELKGPYKKDF